MFMTSMCWVNCLPRRQHILTWWIHDSSNMSTLFHCFMFHSWYSWAHCRHKWCWCLVNRSTREGCLLQSYILQSAPKTFYLDLHFFLAVSWTTSYCQFCFTKWGSLWHPLLVLTCKHHVCHLLLVSPSFMQLLEILPTWACKHSTRLAVSKILIPSHQVTTICSLSKLLISAVSQPPHVHAIAQMIPTHLQQQLNAIFTW